MDIDTIRWYLLGFVACCVLTTIVFKHWSVLRVIIASMLWPGAILVIMYGVFRGLVALAKGK